MLSMRVMWNIEIHMTSALPTKMFVEMSYCEVFISIFYQQKLSSEDKSNITSHTCSIFYMKSTESSGVACLVRAADVVRRSVVQSFETLWYCLAVDVYQLMSTVIFSPLRASASVL